MSTDSAQLLTPREAAKELRVHPRTILRRIEAGELPAIRVGNGPRAPFRIFADDLAAYVVMRKS